MKITLLKEVKTNEKRIKWKTDQIALWNAFLYGAHRQEKVRRVGEFVRRTKYWTSLCNFQQTR